MYHICHFYIWQMYIYVYVNKNSPDEQEYDL